MKKLIAEVATLFGSILLFITVIFTVVSIVANNDFVRKTFLSATMTDETNVIDQSNANQDDEALQTASAISGEPTTIAASTTTYKDWSELTSIPLGYSSSTLTYSFSGTNQTTMYVTAGQQTWNNESNKRSNSSSCSISRRNIYDKNN